MLIVGGSGVVLGLTADWIGLSAEPGIGGLQLGLIAAGVAVTLWGGLNHRPRAQRALSRVYAMVISIYLALWIVELLLAYPLNTRRNFKPHALSLQGLYEVGDGVSIRHVAGWSGTFDDGILQIPIQINSRGDRDDEPRDEHPIEGRIILIGDSFTFGQGLTDDQTIDHRVEHRSEGWVDAYNLGVMGYGPSDSLARLEESRWWEGRAVYYLFFENDVEDGNARPNSYSVHDGFVVPRFRPDGELYTPEQWTQMLAAVRQHNLHKKHQLSFTFSLPRLRQSAYQAMHRNTRLTGIPANQVQPAAIDSAIDYTVQMQRHVSERGASFTVVILPASGEAAAGEYSDWGEAYIDGVKARDIEVLEVLDRLERDDYFDHDPHFDANGADKVADAILAHFRGASGSP